MNRFEQLIEFVINDEEQKARDLFHDIVVEKSRQIYEDIMSEEDEVVEEDLGGDASADLINDVESEEQTMNLEAEEMDDEEMSDMDDEEMSDMDDEEMDGDAEFDDDESFTMGDEGGDEPATKDDILNLEDKLDQLMSEFEDLLSGGDDMAGDDMDMEIAGDDMAGDNMEEMMPMAEAISLKAAPKPVTSEEGGVYKKSAVAANSGAKGAVASPVKMTGDTAQGRPAPKAAEIGVGSSSPKQGPAPKPVTSQASGVNTKTPFPKG